MIIMSVDDYNEENFPEDFSAEVIDDYLLNDGGNYHLYSSKDLNKLYLRNQILASNSM